ncbi:glycosyltransferase [Streptomyces massasporeus]|uniref:glycosyltransferase n=1 Tax=Streptomyces massasporeus TaxID=67324 RepID=UPI003451F701
MTALSLCLIVKDEQDYLERCVHSAQAAVDEVVIIDTGSSDATPQIARRLADVYAEFPFKGDFSQARNEALRWASGDWVLFLDADEELPADSARALPGLVAEASRDVGGMTLARYNFFGNAGFYVTPELKLHRRHPEVRYERTINESLWGAIDRTGAKVVGSGLILNHFGHCRSLASREEKAARYLATFETEMFQHPSDPFFPAFRALILRTLGRFDEARNFAEQARSLDPMSPLINMFYGHVIRALGDPQRTLAAYEHALSLAPDDPALLNMTGVALIEAGRPEEAIEFFTAAGRVDASFLHARINLGLVAQSQERWAEAAELFASALAANPAFGHYDWNAHVEIDYFRATHFETPFGYHGLGYHLAYARMRADQLGA